MKLKINILLMVSLFCCMQCANADVFVRVDELGNTTYTNIKDISTMEEPSVNEINSASEKHSTVKEKSADFVISPEVQSTRDNKRKKILQAELDSELVLANSEKDPAAKQAHIRNIELLKKELSR